MTTPLTVTAGDDVIANVAEADATLPIEGAATVKLAADVPALDALVRLLSAFGIALARRRADRLARRRFRRHR